ncbi:MAG: hypothetical protein GX038_01685 [Erysipelothrix sp.]|nr:hypothetical protein [Erysipelothrix sp.]
MKIEILFPELCAMYGDNGNILLLEKTFGKENVIRTSILEKPRFLSEDIDMVYMGAMSEKTQIQVLDILHPVLDKLKEKIENNMKVLFTGNATDLLGTKIIEEDKSVIKGLGLFDFETVIKRSPRLNVVLYGSYEGIPMVGHKTQFTESFSKDHTDYLFKVDKGMGINRNSMLEGFVYKGLVGTNITGPFLVMNPGFAKAYLETEIPHMELLEETQAKRIEDTKGIKEIFY